VKNLKMLILAFGALGIVSMFIPQDGFTWFSLFKAMGMGQLVLMLAAFAAPAAMGAMALKAPMQKWQKGVALAGFALGCVKLRIWEVLPHIGELFKMFPMLLMVVAALGGVIVSGISLTKSE
jgi:hypothetical protein